MKKLMTLFVAAVAICSCSPKLYDAANATVDKKVFAEQYKLNKAEWDAAFAFLQRPDLAELKAGQYEVLGRTYAKVQIDRTREVVNYEDHHNVIDLFYIVEGEELINVCKPEDLTELVSAYNEKKDVELYKSAKNSHPVVLTKGKYIILFPSDAHQPMLPPDGKPAPIHKIVLKIPYISE